MANLSGQERARYVQGMFERIAPRYDLMNRLMTAGLDVRWRRELIRRAALPSGGRLLDLGAGTGDLAYEAGRQFPGEVIIAADFTLEMMRIGKERSNPRSPISSGRLSWCAADALNLPFHEANFDALVSGFLLRNLSDLPRALEEQYRVLKPGGRWVALDTTQPPRNLFSPLIDFHLNRIIPALGQVISGDREAYTYLPDTTRRFLEAERLAAQLVNTGFRQVGFRRLMWGIVAIHWGVR